MDLGEEFNGNSLLALSVVDVGTTLIIFPGSHDLTSGRRNRNRPVSFGFDVRDICYFHPRLIHCGDKYRR